MVRGLASETDYTIQVRVVGGSNVSDPGEATATTTASTNNPPVFSEDSTTREVASGSPAFTPVGEPVTATDADNDDLIYTLDDATDSFGISSGSGQIRVVDVDYSRASYAVTVKASDATASDTISVTINITDSEDGTPEPEPEPEAVNLSCRSRNRRTLPVLPLGGPGTVLLALLLGVAALRRRRRP